MTLQELADLVTFREQDAADLAEERLEAPPNWPPVEPSDWD